MSDPTVPESISCREVGRWLWRLINLLTAQADALAELGLETPDSREILMRMTRTASRLFDGNFEIKDPWRLVFVCEELSRVRVDPQADSFLPELQRFQCMARAALNNQDMSEFVP